MLDQRLCMFQLAKFPQSDGRASPFRRAAAACLGQPKKQAHGSDRNQRTNKHKKRPNAPVLWQPDNACENYSSAAKMQQARRALDLYDVDGAAANAFPSKDWKEAVGAVAPLPAAPLCEDYVEVEEGDDEDDEDFVVLNVETRVIAVD